jgi:hypothetical protein
MTYNPDEWEIGDLAWITTNPDDERVVARNQGRHLRMLIERGTAGESVNPNNGRTSRWRVGSKHWIAANGAWVRADPSRPGMILNAERVIAVEPEVLAQQNDRSTPAYPRQAMTWAPSGGDTMHATLYSTAGLEAPIPVSRIRAVEMTMPDGTTWRVDD